MLSCPTLGGNEMTPISLFYGIIVYMYTDKSKELKVPHVHAVYKDEEVIIALTGEVLDYL